MVKESVSWSHNISRLGDEAKPHIPDGISLLEELIRAGVHPASDKIHDAKGAKDYTHESIVLALLECQGITEVEVSIHEVSQAVSMTEDSTGNGHQGSAPYVSDHCGRTPSVPVPIDIIQTVPAPISPPENEEKYCVECHHAQGPQTLRQRRHKFLTDMLLMSESSGTTPALSSPFEFLGSIPTKCDWAVECGTIGAWHKCPKRQKVTYAQTVDEPKSWLVEKRKELVLLLQEREAKKLGCEPIIISTLISPEQISIEEDAELITF